MKTTVTKFAERSEKRKSEKKVKAKQVNTVKENLNEQEQKIEHKDEDNRSRYFVSEKILSTLNNKFPKQRWTSSYKVGDMIPEDPFYVGYYHKVCDELGLQPDYSSIYYRLNQLDATQFDDHKGSMELEFSQTGHFLISNEGDSYGFGSVPTDAPQGVRFMGQYGEGKRKYLLFGPKGDIKVKSKVEKEMESEMAVVEAMIIAHRGLPRDEKLKRSIFSKFTIACNKFGVPVHKHQKLLERVMKAIWQDNFDVIPFAFIEFLIAKFPKDSTFEAVAGILRLENQGGILDEEIRKLYFKLRSKSEDAWQHIMAMELLNRFSFPGLGAMSLGTVVMDICGEHLCSKPITYEVEAKDVMWAMVKLCKERVAYVQCGPTIEGYLPQVSRCCAHNTINALETRFVTNVATYNVDSEDEKKSMDLFLSALRNQVGYDTAKIMSYEEFIDSMTWPRSMKNEAYELLPEIEGKEELWLDTKTRAFAKWEELKNKADLNSRLIQGFSLGFSLITGRVIKSMYAFLKKKLSDPHNLLCIGSMMSAEQIGEWHRQAHENGEGITGLDGEAYDSTTRKNPVLTLFSFYQEMSEEKLPGLDILKKSLKLEGSLYNHGIKYRLPNELYKDGWAPMASGRADTTLTNSLLRLREGLWYLHLAGKQGSILASGDDLNIRTVGHIDYKAAGSTIGRSEKIETTERDNTIFLRKKMYPVANRLIPGVMIGRSLFKMCWVKGDVAAKKRLGVIRGDALGRLACDSHVPLVKEFCERILVLTEGKKARRPEYEHNKLTYEMKHEYDESTLEFVCNMYNIGRQDLEEAKEEIKSMQLDSMFKHWVFKRIFDIDVGSTETLRTEIRSSQEHSIIPKVPQYLMTYAGLNGQNLFLIYAVLIAPIVEEISKRVMNPFVGAFFISTLEANTMFGVFWPDLIARFIFHYWAATQPLYYGILIHFLHNLICVFFPFGNMFFPIVWTSSLKQWANYVQLFYNIGLFYTSFLTYVEEPVLTKVMKTVLGVFKSSKRLTDFLYIDVYGWMFDLFRRVLLYCGIQIPERQSVMMRLDKFVFGAPLASYAFNTSGLNLWPTMSLATKGKIESKFRRVPDLFKSMGDCLGTINNRITLWLQHVSAALLECHHMIKRLAPKSKTSKKTTQRGGKKQKSKGSLGRSLATAGLGALGTAFAGAPGAAFGSKVGSFLSDILGMGDYEVKSNSLTTQGSIMPATSGVPTFHSNNRSVRVRHREYLQDVQSSIAFSLQAWNLNPGLSGTFPWLSSIAENFAAYKFHGLVFEFWSTSADALNNINTALGTVVMATQYNSARSNFASKAEMEQYEFTTSCKPSMSMIHPVECASGETPLQELYVRTGSLPAGETIQFYDYGKFQLASVGMQNANTIGELWVSYDVELFKPRISPGLYSGTYARLNNGPYDANNLLGAIQTTPLGDLGITISAVGAGWDTINIPAYWTTGSFLLYVSWVGTGAANCNQPTITLSNLTPVNRMNLSSSSGFPGPSGGTSNSQVFEYVTALSITGANANGSTIRFSAGTLPTTPTYVNVILVGIPQSESFV